MDVAFAAGAAEANEGQPPHDAARAAERVEPLLQIAPAAEANVHAARPAQAENEPECSHGPVRLQPGVVEPQRPCEADAEQKPVP